MTLKCPKCAGTMQEVQKYGIALDYCPACKGLWLDRGEIDKIVQSSDVPSGGAPPSGKPELSRILVELRSEGRIS